MSRQTDTPKVYEEQGSGDIDNLLNSIRITNEGMKINLSIVNEMINDYQLVMTRSNIQPSERTVLIVEDDLRFARILIDKAHQEGLKAIVAISYIEVFDFINRFNPGCYHPRREATGHQWMESAV